MPPDFNPSYQSPHWAWWIVLYFFFGGITGGVYFAAALLDLVGDERDRPLVRLGHLLAFPLLLLCAVFLIVDLGQPLRFWHMIFQSERFPLPILKAYSPMSLGSGILAVFGGVTFLSFLDAVLGGRRGWLHAPDNPLGKIVSVVGAIGGLSLAGYTGVLLDVANIPVWGNSPWIGALFLFSGISSGLALLLLLARRYPHATAEKIETADGYLMVLELIVLVVFLLGLGVVGSRFIWSNPPVALLFAVVLVLGLLVPLGLRFLPSRSGRSTLNRTAVAAVCVLVGGFALRWAVLAAPQGFLL
jgi:protein NrfD